MQQSYRQFLLTASSDDKLNLYFLFYFSLQKIDSEPSFLTDFISFGEYYEYINTVESRMPWHNWHNG